MRLPNSAHTSLPWRIHAIAPDFRVEDVWALPTPGEAGDFPALLELVTGADVARGGGSPIVRALFAIRWKLGALLGWDAQEHVPTLRERVPAGLPAPVPARPPFTALYMTGDEWAAEIANRTVHGVLHLGWVPDSDGRYRGQMAVLVRRNGRLGAAYMAAIAPFRHRIVYPAMLSELGRRWAAR
jgi:hypothetical protein